MMKIKIVHYNNSITYEVDSKNQTASIIENDSDGVLQMIFDGRKNFKDLESWITARVGGLDFDSTIKIIKKNEGKSVKDNLFIKISK